MEEIQRLVKEMQEWADEVRSMSTPIHHFYREFAHEFVPKLVRIAEILSEEIGVEKIG